MATQPEHQLHPHSTQRVCISENADEATTSRARSNPTPPSTVPLPPRPKTTTQALTPQPGVSGSGSSPPPLILLKKEQRQQRSEQERERRREESGKQRQALGDLDQIVGWLDECRSHHGRWCNNRYHEHLPSHLESLTLVNVHTNALFILPVSTPFVALSYVWV